MAEETKTPRRRVRRQFTDAYKAEAVRMVLDEGRTVGAVARDLDLTGSAPPQHAPAQDAWLRHTG